MCGINSASTVGVSQITQSVLQADPTSKDATEGGAVGGASGIQGLIGNVSQSGGSKGSTGANRLTDLITQLSQLIQTIQQLVGQLGGGSSNSSNNPTQVRSQGTPTISAQTNSGGFATGPVPEAELAKLGLDHLTDNADAAAADVFQTAKQHKEELTYQVNQSFDASGVNAQAGEALLRLRSEVLDRTNFLDKVVNTIEQNKQTTGTYNIGASLQVDKDTATLSTTDRFLRKLAAAGSSLTVDDVKKAEAVLHGQQQGGGGLITGILDVRTDLRVRSGDLSATTAKFLEDAVRALEGKKDFIGTRVIPTIYENAKSSGTINQEALKGVEQDSAAIVKATDRAMDIFFGGKSLSDQDVAQAQQLLNSRQGPVAAIDFLASRLPAGAPTS